MKILQSQLLPTEFQSRIYVQTGPSEVSQMAPYAIIFQNTFVGLQEKPLQKSYAVGDSYGTGNDIWAGFGVVGINEKKKQF